MQSVNYDVAVIGGGAAGLCASAALCGSGCSLVLLEARDRLGGRMYTLTGAGVPYPIELGAEFIHGDAPVTRQLLRAARLTAVDTAGLRITRQHGAWSQRQDNFHDLERLMQRASALPQDESVAQFLQHCAGGFDSATLEMVRLMVEGFDAADPKLASVKAIAEEWSGSSLEGQSRPLGGYATVLEYFARTLQAANVKVMLSTVVESVAWGAAGVGLSVRTASGTLSIRARRAIVTLPVSLLRADPSAAATVRFDPPLAAKEQALRGLSLGPVVKIVLQFRRPFWEQLQARQLADAGFMHTPDAPLPTLWSALPLRLPYLTAWSGGPGAHELAQREPRAVVQAALTSVAAFLAVSEQQVGEELIASHWHDWSADPFSRGAYCYLNVGGQQAPAQLAQPLQDRLYFAGDATNRDSTGTVEAALASGRDAATAVLAAAALSS